MLSFFFFPVNIYESKQRHKNRERYFATATNPLNASDFERIVDYHYSLVGFSFGD